MIPSSTASTGVLKPGRGARTFSIPCDSSGYTVGYVGTNGIHFGTQLDNLAVLFGCPIAAASAGGAVYLSAIHGGLGSDAVDPYTAVPYDAVSVESCAFPAFANPEVTGFYTSGPLIGDNLKNGFLNTEKRQRLPGDKSPTGDPTNYATVWEPLQGRTRLNFCLWISSTVSSSDLVALYLYQDLNRADKISGFFGAGGGDFDIQNALLVSQWTALSGVEGDQAPTLASSAAFDLTAGCNLYLVFKNLSGNDRNNAVGTIWFS